MTHSALDTGVSRRGVLAGGAAVAGLVAASPLLTSSPRAYAADTSAAPFTLGVASGDPLQDGIVLWTRLATDPLGGGGMPDKPVEVAWQLATDQAFSQVVKQGTATATPALGHSVHVDVRGLDAARFYYYRFQALGVTSPVGRTKTAPKLGLPLSSMRFAVVNCQDFQNGYWPAYANLATEDVDLVVHVGDYIYEYDPRSVYADRLHTQTEAYQAGKGNDQLNTLSDYRNRYAQYKMDPALQAAHAMFPWSVTWDDHETENNYATDIDEIDDTGDKFQDRQAFLAQRARAYQAYYEHMPLRIDYSVGITGYQLWRRLRFGDLLTMTIHDTRQYRTDQPGQQSQDFGPPQFGIDNVRGRLLDARQEGWLFASLAQNATAASPRTRWHAVAQQVMMGKTLFPNFLDLPNLFTKPLANLDQWDGYVPQRNRILAGVQNLRARNVVVLSGDIHSSWVNDLKPNFYDPTSPTVATEFVATSISSDFPAAFDPAVRGFNPTANPTVKYFDGLHRGYLRMTLTKQIWQTDIRVVDTIAERSAPVRTLASFTVEDGVPGAVAT